MTPQLSLFESNFGSTIRRVEISGVLFFSVLDVFKHYNATNPVQSWRGVEKRLQEKTPEILAQTQIYQFPGQGQRLTPIATAAAIEVILGLSKFFQNAPARYVYALAYKEDRTFVKIGKAADLAARLRNYKLHTRPALTPIYLFTLESTSASQIERTLHQRYARVRVRGEWFALPPELLQEAIAYAHSLAEGAS
jgi:hypothetical protein